VCRSVTDSKISSSHSSCRLSGSSTWMLKSLDTTIWQRYVVTAVSKHLINSSKNGSDGVRIHVCRWRHVLQMTKLNAKDSQLLQTLTVDWWTAPLYGRHYRRRIMAPLTNNIDMTVGMQKSNAYRTITQHHRNEQLNKECLRWWHHETPPRLVEQFAAL